VLTSNQSHRGAIGSRVSKATQYNDLMRRIGTAASCESNNSTGTASSAAGKPGDYGEGTDKYSGLKIAGRCLRPQRWEELMKGKRYLAFDKLGAGGVLEKTEENVVAIGIVYERSMAKTSSKGSRYAHWSLTDLNFPQPRLLTLFLHGSAFETWQENPERPVANGAIFAMLNPSPLPDRDGDSKKPSEERRPSLSVSHATQLVLLGTSPSLGYCLSNKKDGMKCSMPCDRDKGPLVCFWHTMHKEAEKVKRFQQARETLNGARSNHSDSSIFIFQSGPKSLPTTPASRSRVMPTAQTPKTTHPPGACARDSALDAATKRLLSGTSKTRVYANPPQPQRPQATPARSSSSQPPQQTPRTASSLSSTAGLGRSREWTSKSEQPEQQQQQHLLQKQTQQEQQQTQNITDSLLAGMGIPSPAAGAQVRNQLLAMFPGGIPAPNPNGPQVRASSVPTGVAASAPSKMRIDVSLAAGQNTSGHQTCKRWQSQAARTSQRKLVVPEPIVVISAESAAKHGLIRSNDRPIIKPGGGSSPARRRPSAKQLEAEFGARIATQLLNTVDPRKDLVRSQGSRFQSFAEEERHAQRVRKLSELEMQDAHAEKMEALMNITVPAYRCQECRLTTDSERSRAFCEQQGHHVERVQAKKERWECVACKFDVSAFDGQTPPVCERCNANVWKQVPLRRTRTTAMPKDFLLARGEELPYLNSIAPQPGHKSVKRFQEKADDYSALNNPLGA